MYGTQFDEKVINIIFKIEELKEVFKYPFTVEYITATSGGGYVTFKYSIYNKVRVYRITPSAICEKTIGGLIDMLIDEQFQVKE